MTHQKVRDRRDAILAILQAAQPAGLTREEVAAQTGTNWTTKMDLLALAKQKRVVCRSGGRRPGSSNGYLRKWHWLPQSQPPATTTPLYDGLAIALDAGAQIRLTSELLARLRDELCAREKS